LVGFANIKDQLDEKGVSVVAASVDPLDKAKEVSDEVNFPIGFGVTKSIADSVGAWWEERRQIIQPSEFLLNSENKVMISSYSDGPLGRFDAQDVIKLINFYEKQSS
jgi:peroxiredoxin